MTDRISNLPDAVLCHILSFLPTKVSVATSVLSKRWKPLWRSVSALDFDHEVCDIKNDSYSFVQSVYAFILTRDFDNPLQRFQLRYCLRDPGNVINANAWLAAAARCKVERLDFSMHDGICDLPAAAVLSCKTLVVLKLTNFELSFKPSSVDFPSLKILRLHDVDFSEYRDLEELLSGSPNLEELEVDNLWFNSGHVVEGKFKRLPKLIRAYVAADDFPLEMVNNAEFLHIEGVDHKGLIPEFQNLTHIIFGYGVKGLKVLDVIKHCPNLQILVIDEVSLELFAEGDEGYPQCVPICLSLHLRTCSFKDYEGSEAEFRFARYVMQNARHLRTMTIHSGANQGEKLEMLKKLSSCTRCSATCTLSFD